MSVNLKLSVHQLVDFLLRTGDIDDRVFNQTSMNEGTRLHVLYQNKNKNSLIEYNLNTSFQTEDFFITLQGKADLIKEYNGPCPIIEEFKTVNNDVQTYFEKNKQWHLGQAICYAYMYLLTTHNIGLTSNDKKCIVSLVYMSQQSKEIELTHQENYSFIELERIVNGYINSYLEYYLKIENLKRLRDESLMTLMFPFKTFRKNQETLMKNISDSIENRENTFLEAATGSGKTISILFPAIKSQYQTIDRKIFFLTAKNSGSEAATKAIAILNKKGYQGKSISIRSKEKTCPFKERLCNPDDCPYAQGYYEKINQVVLSSLSQYDLITKDEIDQIATENQICPFELQLDLSTFADVIIADYNYFFDPVVYFQRHFADEYNDDIILVDEAHNLKARSEDMHSIDFPYSLIENAKEIIKQIHDEGLEKKLKSLDLIFKKISAINDLGYTIVEQFDPKFLNRIEDFNQQYLEFLKNSNHQRKISALRDLFFVTNRFFKLNELATTTSYVRCLNITNNDKIISIKCLSTKNEIGHLIEGAASTIFFSGTLSPLGYYKEIYGGQEFDQIYKYHSPFEAENFKVYYATNLDLRYQYRRQYAGDVATYIRAAVDSHTGNYMAFFSSYEYLNEVLPYLDLKARILVQKQKMSLKEQEDFLTSFKKAPTVSTLGLCVLGGVFSESIDLTEDRLTGVIIVGLGLPNPNDFNTLKKGDFYESLGLNRYLYAFLYPTIAKLLQTVGRVIRTENDRGFALLIDKRFQRSDHHFEINERYLNYEFVSSLSQFRQSLNRFIKDLKNE